MEETRQGQARLLLYTLVSFFSFTYLILPENAGISVVVFMIIQGVFLYFLAPNKKSLWVLAPLFILSFNSFLYAGTLWRVSNVLVGMLLYTLIGGQIFRQKGGLGFTRELFCRAARPVFHMALPLRWCAGLDEERTKLLKRIFMGVAIALPSLAFLIALLSSADLVFSQGAARMISDFFSAFQFHVIWKVLYGLFIGFYLFGMVYEARLDGKKAVRRPGGTGRGDSLVLAIVFCSILAVYTVFVFVQFKYLFAGAALPDGMSYSQYARRGFFELFFLTGINVGLILLALYLVRGRSGRESSLIKGLCCYLCGVTLILLASSFYRMWLYSSDDGLTRLRFLVFGFLIFEAAGLLITFFYIIRPKFNIVMVYLGIGLCYYLVLNLVPVDYFVAKSQVDRYFSNQSAGIAYVTTLSADAAPQIERLLEDPRADEAVRQQARDYLENQKAYYQSLPRRWQRYNLSVSRVMGE